RIHDLKTGQIVKVLTPPTTLPVFNSVEALSFSPDGTHLASGSLDGSVRLWNIRSKFQEAILGFHMPAGDPNADPRTNSAIVYDLQFSRDGHHLISCGRDGSLKLWNVDQRSLQATLLQDEEPLRAVAFSPDGSYIVCGGDSRTVYLLSAATGQVINKRLLQEEHPIYRLSFGPDSHTLLT